MGRSAPLWKRSSRKRWYAIRNKQLELHPCCVVCGEGRAYQSGLTLTAHHLHYGREAEGREPRPGMDLVTIHHETCHKFVEWLIRTQGLPREDAHLTAANLGPLIAKERGMHSISQWYDPNDDDPYNMRWLGEQRRIERLAAMRFDDAPSQECGVKVFA